VQYSSPSYSYLLANRTSQHTFTSNDLSTTTRGACRFELQDVDWSHPIPASNTSSVSSQVNALFTDRKKPSERLPTDAVTCCVRGASVAAVVAVAVVVAPREIIYVG